MGKNPETNKGKAQLVVTSSLTQEDIPALIDQVKDQIIVLSAKAGLDISKTTGNLAGFGTIDSIDTVEKLIMADASIYERARAYEAAAKRIVSEGIRTPELKIDGHTEKEWATHIASRVFEVANEKKLAKLREMQAKLESNLSAKDKLANDLNEINKELAMGL